MIENIFHAAGRGCHGKGAGGGCEESEGGEKFA